jgi:thiol-disulfide isomerase/thioredoxin
MVRTLVALLVMSVGANFVEYEKWFAGEKAEGRHYVLVSAEWCPPCGRLKSRLASKKYDGKTIVILDVDKHPDLSSKILKGKTIPTLIEYNLSGGEWKPARFWDGVDLDKFLNGE